MTWIPNYFLGNRMVSWLTNHSTNELLWTIWIPNQFAIQIPTVHWRFDCTHLNQQCDIQEWARATRARQRERDSWVVWEQRRRCRPPQGAWQSWTRVHRRRLPGEQSGTSNCKKEMLKMAGQVKVVHILTLESRCVPVVGGSVLISRTQPYR